MREEINVIRYSGRFPHLSITSTLASQGLLANHVANLYPRYAAVLISHWAKPTSRLVVFVGRSLKLVACSGTMAAPK